MRTAHRGLTHLACLFAALAALAAAGPACAQSQEPEVTLPACGIRYPGGFDPNTVGVVEGRISAFALPERGPVTFRLDAPGETYVVLAAPFWYWQELKLTFRDGDRLRVKGSKTMGADGNLYLVVQWIEIAGAEKPVVLRDARGKPAWSGRGPRGSERRGR